MLKKTHLSFIILLLILLFFNRVYAVDIISNDQARELIKTGEKAYISGDKQKSINCFNQVLKNEKFCHVALYNLGVVYSHMGNLDLAVNMENKAIEKNRTYLPAYIQLSYLYQKTNNLNKAKNILLDAYEINPNNSIIQEELNQINLELERLTVHQNNQESGVVNNTQTEMNRAKNTQFYSSKAVEPKAKGEQIPKPEVKTTVSKAVEPKAKEEQLLKLQNEILENNQTNTQNIKVSLYQKEEKKLIENLGLKIKVNQPNNLQNTQHNKINQDQEARQYIKIANNYLQAQNYEMAKINYQKSLNLNSNLEEALIGQIAALVNLKSIKEAQSLQELANKKFPEKPLTFIGQAYIDVNQNNFKKAQDNLIKVLEKDKQNKLAKLLLAKVYLNLNENNQAQKLYEEILQTDPQDPNIYFGLAIVNIRQNQLETANKNINMAIELAPKNEMFLTTKQKLARINLDQDKIKREPK